MAPVVIGPGPGEDGQKCPHPDPLSGEWALGYGLSGWLGLPLLCMRQRLLSPAPLRGCGTLSKAPQLKLQSPRLELGRLGLMYAKPSAASGCAISDCCNVAKKSRTH